jgi:hypothetical protein
VPPAIAHLPELSLPAEVEVADDALEATVRVGVDGRAVLEESSAHGLLRERIEALLREARFVPGSVDGVPREARVRVRFRVAELAGPVPVPTPGGEPEASDPPASPLEFGARAEIEPPRPTARKLELVAMREVPGAFGDPFRVLDTLPGVVPVTEATGTGSTGSSVSDPAATSAGGGSGDGSQDGAALGSGVESRSLWA